MSDDRRKYPRVKVSIHIEWGLTRACEFYTDRITSLSLGGCFIQTEQPGARGDTLYVRLWNSPESGGVLEGRVAYQLNVAEEKPPIGFGVQFVGLTEYDVQNLKHLLEFYSEKAT